MGKVSKVGLLAVGLCLASSIGAMARTDVQRGIRHMDGIELPRGPPPPDAAQLSPPEVTVPSDEFLSESNALPPSGLEQHASTTVAPATTSSSSTSSSTEDICVELCKVGAGGALCNCGQPPALMLHPRDKGAPTTSSQRPYVRGRVRICRHLCSVHGHVPGCHCAGSDDYPLPPDIAELRSAAAVDDDDLLRDDEPLCTALCRDGTGGSLCECGMVPPPAKSDQNPPTPPP